MGSPTDAGRSAGSARDGAAEIAEQIRPSGPGTRPAAVDVAAGHRTALVAVGVAHDDDRDVRGRRRQPGGVEVVAGLVGDVDDPPVARGPQPVEHGHHRRGPHVARPAIARDGQRGQAAEPGERLDPLGVEGQHRLARGVADLAQRFNSRYRKTFRLPEPYILKSTAKIGDLQEPTAKMSKSASSPSGIIEMLDEPKASAKVVRLVVAFLFCWLVAKVVFVEVVIPLRTAGRNARLPLSATLVTYTFRGGRPVAGDLALAPGDRVRLYSRRGSVLAVEQTSRTAGLEVENLPRRSWSRIRTLGEVRRAVQERYPGFDLRSFEVLRRGVSGRVARLRLLGGRGEQREADRQGPRPTPVPQGGVVVGTDRRAERRPVLAGQEHPRHHEVAGRVARAQVAEVDGIDPDYALSAQKYLGDEAARDYLAMVDQPGTRMARITVRPTWVGLLDFAGGLVVHLNAGVAGLVAAYVVGARRGYGALAVVGAAERAGANRRVLEAIRDDLELTGVDGPDAVAIAFTRELFRERTVRPETFGAAVESVVAV